MKDKRLQYELINLKAIIEKSFWALENGDLRDFSGCIMDIRQSVHIIGRRHDEIFELMKEPFEEPTKPKKNDT